MCLVVYLTRLQARETIFPLVETFDRLAAMCNDYGNRPGANLIHNWMQRLQTFVYGERKKPLYI